MDETSIERPIAMFTDSIAVKRFAELHARYRFDYLFETGTHLGVGAMKASEFCSVITVEINPEFRDKALVYWLKNGRRISSVQNGQYLAFHVDWASNRIISYEGDSPVVMRIAWPEWKREKLRICWYLDAHWQEKLPLREELSVIAELGINDGVIMIHDCLVPGKEGVLNCDSYHGQPISYEFVKDLLFQINPDYKIEYNSESSTGRGILYALPPC